MPEKKLLTIVQDFCKRKGLPVPPVAAGASDDTTVQVVALLNEGIQSICDRYKWQQLTTLAQFNHANGSQYMALDFGITNTAFPDWKFNEQQTLWNLSFRIPVVGPLTIPQWQVVVTMLMAAAQYQYILYNNQLHIFPVPNPTTSVMFGFYYQSKCGVVDGTGALTDTYTTDDSTPRLPTYLIEADLGWRWKKEKGLPYAEDMRDCESMIVNAVGRSPQPALNLDGGANTTLGPQPGIFVQPGSWQI